jgi:hypothetical protein
VPVLTKTGTASPVNSSSSKSNFESGSEGLVLPVFKEIELTISYGVNKAKEVVAKTTHTKTSPVFFIEVMHLLKFFGISNCAK